MDENIPIPMIPTRWIDTTPVESADEPAEIRSLDMEVHVSGLYAHVVETIEIFNPNLRDLSVAVSLPMPDRAAVCGYALEIDGQLRDGVVVPKEKARVAFETEQRRGADPGLVEAVKGNVYQTRVYPVWGNRTRRIQLEYTAPLLVVDGSSAFLDVPMPAEHLDKRHLEVEVELLDCPVPELSGANIEGLVETGTCWTARLDEEDVAPSANLRIALPKLPQSFCLVEEDDEGALWFSASEAVPKVDKKEVKVISALTVLWDASGSRAAADHAPELELLHSWCEDGVALSLVEFGEHVGELQKFGGYGEMAEYISGIRYDGGTDFAALSRFLAETGGKTPYVLFTDGMDTLAAGAVSFPADLDILAVISGTNRDIESLHQACGGLAFDIAAAPRGAAALAETLYCSNLLSGVEGAGISNVLGIGSGHDGRFSAIGKLSADTRENVFSTTGTSFAVDSSTARRGSAISRAWAAKRVSQLSPRATDNAAELLALGRRFGVVSPETSLLVLETADQWVRYDIEPPESWPEMHDAWKRIVPGLMKVSDEEHRKQLHLSQLKEEWKKTLEWWEKDYPVAPQPSERRQLPDGFPMSMPDRGGNIFTSVREHAASFAERMTGAVRAARPEPGEGMLLTSIHSAASVDEEPCREAASRSPMSFDSAPESATIDFDARPMGSAPVFANSMAGGFVPMEAGAPAAVLDSFDEDGFADFAVAEEAVDETPASESSGMSVKVSAWMPDAAYLEALAQAGEEGARDAYFAQRAEYASSPSFFIDCAGWFLEHGDKPFGLQVLTNLSEMKIEDAAMLRVMAWRLREAGELERALAILRHVLALRHEDSQSHRDVALVLDQLARESYAAGDEDAARAYAEEAGEFYREIATTPWQRRALAIGLFAVEEYNVMRAWAAAQKWKDAPELPAMGPELEGVLDCDLRITLAWDADETDVDIHVTEPNGIEAYYGNRFTSSGGRVSEDITDGYGPELYEIRHAEKGIYNIRAHYYASHQQSVFGPASCTLTVFTDWGRPEQAQQVTSTRLDKERQMVDVGKAAYGDIGELEQEQEEAGKTIDVDTMRVEKGMTPEELIAVFGPCDGASPERDSMSTMVWNMETRQRVAFLEDGHAVKLIERMRWGEEMVIFQ